MRLREIKNIFHAELAELFPKEEIDSFFYLSIEHHLELERFVLAVQPGLSVSKEEEKLLFDIIHRLKEQEPIQYILGESHFAGLRFKVNPSVLIPRPETEELVQWVVNDKARGDQNYTILDIGTGSGCIAITLAKLMPTAKVYAIDVSAQALELAEENAALNGVDVIFKQLDIKSLDSMGVLFDVIVSNPPYIRLSERELIKENVSRYEPETALFVPDEDPLIFYRHICRFAQNNLKPKGSLYMEVNQYLAKDTYSLFEEEKFSEIGLRNDMFGKSRMLKVKI